MAGSLCAFAMYLFWWNKPLSIKEPIVIRDESLAPLAAFMYCSSEISGYVSPERVQSQTAVKTFFAYFNLYSKVPEIEHICFRGVLPVSDHEDPKGAEMKMIPDASVTSDSHGDEESYPSSFRRVQRKCTQELEARRKREDETAFFERRPRVVVQRPVSETESKMEQARLSLLELARQSYPELFQERILVRHTIHGVDCSHFRAEQLVADHIQNWPSNDLLRNVNGLVVGMVLWFASFCYGGIHAAAWNDHFPSEAEKWMWRASAVYIGFCGGLWIVLNFLVIRNPRLNSFWENWMDGKKTWWQSIGLGVVVSCVWPESHDRARFHCG